MSSEILHLAHMIVKFLTELSNFHTKLGSLIAADLKLGLGATPVLREMTNHLILSLMFGDS
jgi:hypothetical protein